jgi:hypothetical protein
LPLPVYIENYWNISQSKGNGSTVKHTGKSLKVETQ